MRILVCIWVFTGLLFSPVLAKTPVMASGDWQVVLHYGNIYSLTISPDGTIIYEPRVRGWTSPVPLEDRFTYMVPVSRVKQLPEIVAAADFWSLKDEYRRSYSHPNINTTIVVRTGKTVKSVTEENGREAGMPEAAYNLTRDIKQIAEFGMWEHLSLRTLYVLDQNGFDYKSQSGADLAVEAARDHQVSDQTLFALLDKGVDTDNGSFQFGENPLYRRNQPLIVAAAERGRTSVLSRLIDLGAFEEGTQSVQSKINNTFYAAIGSGCAEAVTLMLAYKPDLNGNYSYAPEVVFSPIPALFFVRREDSETSVKIMQILIRSGASANSRRFGSETALMYFSAYPKIVAYLLSEGADINARDKTGNTALLNSYSAETALMFLELGANPCIANDSGKTILDIAKSYTAPTWLDVQARVSQYGCKPVN